jgi:hypothetical protein
MVQKKNIEPDAFSAERLKEIQAIADAPVRIAHKPAEGPQYTFGNAEVSFGVQTQAEFVAFVNWLYGDRAKPLEAVESDHPRVL